MKQKKLNLEELMKFLHTPRYNTGEFHIEGKKFECDFSTGLCQIRVDGAPVWSGMDSPNLEDLKDLVSHIR